MALFVRGVNFYPYLSYSSCHVPKYSTAMLYVGLVKASTQDEFFIFLSSRFLMLFVETDEIHFTFTLIWESRLANEMSTRIGTGHKNEKYYLCTWKRNMTQRRSTTSWISLFLSLWLKSRLLFLCRASHTCDEAS